MTTENKIKITEKRIKDAGFVIAKSVYNKEQNCLALGIENMTKEIANSIIDEVNNNPYTNFEKNCINGSFVMIFFKEN